MPFAWTGERRLWIVLVVAACALTAWYTWMGGVGFPLDDSYIHLTYARNLAQRGEWAFLPGVPSAASTSPLYTVILAVGFLFGAAPTVWPYLVGALALGVTAILGARLAYHAGAAILPERAARGAAWAAGLALAGEWHLLWAAAAGMETILFVMLTLALILCAWRGGISVRGGIIFGVIGALATLARPEGVLLVGLAGLAVVFARMRSVRGALVWTIAAGVAFLVTLAPYLLINLQITGGLLPNTSAAKQTWAEPLLAQPFLWRVRTMVEPLLAGGQILLIPGMTAFAGVKLLNRQDAKKPADMHLRATVLWLLPIAWGAALILLYAARLPLPFQHGRYVIPVLAPWIVIGVVGSAWLLRRLGRGVIGRVVSRALALSAAVMFMVFAFIYGVAAYRQDVQIVEQEMVTTARWIAANIPEGTTIAVHDIGAVGYLAPRPMLDLAGLVSPEVIPALNDSEALWRSVQESGAVYLIGMDDQVPGDNPNDPRLCEVYTTGGALAPVNGGSNMTVYRLNWAGGACSALFTDSVTTD